MTAAHVDFDPGSHTWERGGPRPFLIRFPTASHPSCVSGKLAQVPEKGPAGPLQMHHFLDPESKEPGMRW